MPSQILNLSGFKLQHRPRIYFTAIPGRWLLERTTPSWRIDDPNTGFQRVVREGRAREIAIAVLDQQRTFPNAIVLATDVTDFELKSSSLCLPSNIRFLVVDGQHRLWAQKFSTFEARYPSVIHMGLSEVEMARLFLEINDNQKRVPSSLRWDLVRLVRPDDDPTAIAASEMVFLLSTETESPLFQRVDLTGEQFEIRLKQGSLAPGVKALLSKKSPLHGLSFDTQHRIVLHYFIALQDLGPDTWGTEASRIYKPRVIRALLRLLPDIIKAETKSPENLVANDFLLYLQRIDQDSLEAKKIIAAQGSAGMKAIYDEIHNMVFG